MTYVEPLVLVFLLLGLAGLVRLPRCNGKRWILASIFGILLLSWPPVGWLFSRPLEMRYPVRPFQTSLNPQAIVVLASTVSPPLAERPYLLPDLQTFERCRYAAWLYANWKALPVLACAGSAPSGNAMRELLEQSGVPENMIWTEERSRSTHENALYGADILRKRGLTTIVLVVEARSMPRAELCFRKLGILVAPAPSSFREFDARSREEWIPSWRGIRENEVTLHELVGLAWYRLRGWI
jgi:uncharacterized SAM-binding protein YcdF (DUF218 family)